MQKRYCIAVGWASRTNQPRSVTHSRSTASRVKSLIARALGRCFCRQAGVEATQIRAVALLLSGEGLRDSLKRIITASLNQHRGQYPAGGASAYGRPPIVPAAPKHHPALSSSMSRPISSSTFFDISWVCVCLTLP